MAAQARTSTKQQQVQATTKFMIENDDGTIYVPLKGRSGVTLAESSIDDLEQITEWVQAADASLKDLDFSLEEVAEMTIEARRVARDAIKERVTKINLEHPHADAFLSIVNLLRTDKGEADDKGDVTMGELLSWAANPNACAAVLDHFNRPFGGPSMLTNAKRNGAAALQSATD
jgi:hypothetical protein